MIVENSHKDQQDGRNITLSLSRGTAVILLLIYVLYLWFQLRTHHNLFGSEPAGIESGPAQIEGAEEARHENGTANPAVTGSGESEDEAVMSPWSAAGVLVVTTVLVSICADYLVESIDSLVERGGISRSFIGLILIPIVGNAAEHVTAVVVAIKNKMDLVRNRCFIWALNSPALIRCAGYGRCYRLKYSNSHICDAILSYSGLDHGSRYGSAFRDLFVSPPELA